MITIKAAVVILASLATLGTALPSTLQGQQPDALEKGSAYGNHPREVKHDDDTVFHHTHTDDDAGSTHTHEARATKTLGIYECMNEDFVMPCIWTPLKDGECYNRNYGKLGSMGPDKGLTCAVYEAINCNDHGWIRAEPFVFSGITVYNEDKFLIRAGMEDGPTSVRCTYDSIKLHPAGNNGYNVHL